MRTRSREAKRAVLEDIEKIKTEGVDEDRMRRAAAAIKIAHLKECRRRRMWRRRWGRIISRRGMRISAMRM